MDSSNSITLRKPEGINKVCIIAECHFTLQAKVAGVPFVDFLG